LLVSSNNNFGKYNLTQGKKKKEGILLETLKERGKDGS
jgi:hypothetical protein